MPAASATKAALAARADGSFLASVTKGVTAAVARVARELRLAIAVARDMASADEHSGHFEREIVLF
jgi:hypothetical protein